MHRLKNKDSLMAADLRALRTKRTVMLTGTPLQNSTTEQPSSACKCSPWRPPFVPHRHAAVEFVPHRHAAVEAGLPPEKAKGAAVGAAGRLPSKSAHRSATPTATRGARWIEPLGAICSMLEVCAL